MIRYLLDTDIASYLIKGRSSELQARVDALSPDEWAISAITYAEILAGLEPFSSDHPLKLKTARFLFHATVLSWPVESAAVYASIRYRTRNQPLADLDLLIAAHAITLDAALVTNNARHFSRIGLPLRLENWLG